MSIPISQKTGISIYRYIHIVTSFTCLECIPNFPGEASWEREMFPMTLYV